MTLEDKLTAAAANGRAADVDRLLREGAEVNGLNRFGRSAIQVGVNTARKFETEIHNRALCEELCQTGYLKQPYTVHSKKQKRVFVLMAQSRLFSLFE